MQTTSVFQVRSPDGPTIRIVSANTLGKSLVDMGHRAGYPEDTHVHYEERGSCQGLTVSHLATSRASLAVVDSGVDDGYSTSERMKFGGYSNPKTFLDYYIGHLSKADGPTAL